jgi:hypothetical protein
MNEPHYCQIENAPKFLDWMRSRGGLAVWRSIDMSDPGASWSTPARNRDGSATPKPHPWKSEASPSRVITDPAEVLVVKDREVERFHIALCRGGGGLSVKVSDAGSRRIRKAVEAAGKGAYYEFDHNTQEAVIMAPSDSLTLAEWAEQQKGAE